MREIIQNMMVNFQTKYKLYFISYLINSCMQFVFNYLKIIAENPQSDYKYNNKKVPEGEINLCKLVS